MTVNAILLEFGGYEGNFSKAIVKRMAEEILRLRQEKAQDSACPAEE